MERWLGEHSELEGTVSGAQSGRRVNLSAFADYLSRLHQTRPRPTSSSTTLCSPHLYESSDAYQLPSLRPSLRISHPLPPPFRRRRRRSSYLVPPPQHVGNEFLLSSSYSSLFLHLLYLFTLAQHYAHAPPNETAEVSEIERWLLRGELAVKGLAGRNGREREREREGGARSRSHAHGHED